ncbi:MAG TPA: DUF92 domain-containing protein [Methanocorpusculum sp.]|nr:DUF92 domain-containing protein [Methanocorpusculum sp.]
MDARIKQLVLVLVTTLILLLTPMFTPVVIGAAGIIFSIILYFIFKIRYFSIAAAVLALLYAISFIPVTAFIGPMMMIVWGEAFISAFKKANHQMGFFFAGSTLALLLTVVYLKDTQPLIIVLAVLVLLLLRSILQERTDGSMIALIGVGATITLFEDLEFLVDNMTLAVAVVLCIAFGYFAYRAKTIDLSGVFAAVLIGVILISFANVMWFFVVLAFFIIGSLFTKFKYAVKDKIGVSQSRKGVRGYMNAFANVGVAVIGAILFGLTNNVIFAAMFAGSVAVATADTLASEIGVLGGTPRMITNFRPCPIGTNGGVTMTGEIACMCGSAFIALLSYSFGIIPGYAAVMVFLTGIVGTNLDSLVGALIENRGVIGNSGTNFIATALGGGIALGLTVLCIAAFGLA